MATTKRSKTPAPAALEKAARKLHPEVKKYLAAMVEKINTPEPDTRPLLRAIDMKALRACNPLIQSTSLEDSMDVTLQALQALQMLGFNGANELDLSEDEKEGGRALMDVALHALKIQTEAVCKVLRAVPLSAMPKPEQAEQGGQA